MVIKKKADKPPVYVQTDIDEAIERVIEKGGSVIADKKPTPSTTENVEGDEVRFTLRIPKKLIDKVDAGRKKRVGNVSRNQWILEVIENAKN